MSSSKNRMRRRGHFKEEERVPVFFKMRFFLFALCAVLIIMGIIMSIFDFTGVGYTSYKSSRAFYILYGWEVLLIGIGCTIFVWWFFYKMKDN